MNRQGSEIRIVAGEHNLMHRSLRGGHLDRSHRMRQPLPHHLGKAGFVGIERRGEPPP